MAGPWADVGEANPFQKSADVALAKINAEALLHHPLEIDAPPANDAVFFAVWTRLDYGGEFRQSLGRKPGLDAAGVNVAQAIGPLFIEAMNPIAQGLAIHAADARGVRPVHAVENRRQ